MTRISFLKAANAALHEEMARDDSTFYIGEDVGFNFLGSTGGLLETFGKERVRDTPISEAGFVGAAAGAAMVGMRPIVDMAICPFYYVAFDQMVSIIAKSTYLYGGQASLPITFRASMFYGGGTAAQHSDRPYPTFMTIPGLKILAPTTPYDMKGLLKTAIRDDDPVLIFEDLHVWGAMGEVPDEEYLIPFGQATVARAGTDCTIVAIAGSMPAALQAADQLQSEGLSVEVIDPRTLVPLDTDAILTSISKTGHLVIADPAHETCSAASEISAIMADEGFWYLEAPIRRVTTPQVHIPFSPPLEEGLYPTAERIAEAVRSTVLS